MSYSVASPVFSLGGWRKGRGGCAQNFGHERDFCQAQKAENTDPLTNYAQKNPRVRKIFVRNSGAGSGCVNFMDALKKCALSAGKTHVHKIPRFRGGGGGIWGFGGGGECRFYFYGRADFSDMR